MNEAAYFKAHFFRFGKPGLVMFLALLNAVVPISTDLYLPAMPGMANLFGTSDASVKLTLSLFMLCFALSLLLWGPLSDRYGRKKILTAGLVLYIMASVCCALSQNIEQLIVCRIFQAFSCGAISSVSMAIVKDVFREGRMLENVLIWIQTMTIMGPMIAPVLGAFLLQYVSWRGLFVVLMGGGCIGLGLSLALRETIAERLDVSPFQSFARIGFVLSNRGYRSLLLIFALGAMPFMAFLGSSAFIYEKGFGTSSQVYSYFFALNASFSFIGPMIYARFLRKIPRVRYLKMVFSVTLVSGVLLILFGSNGPWFFALLFIPITFMGSAMRPVGAVLMMSQLDSDNGTVVGLMTSSALLFGSMSMLIASLGWSNLVVAVGCISLVCGSLCLFLWIRANRLGVYRIPSMT